MTGGEKRKRDDEKHEDDQNGMEWNGLAPKDDVKCSVKSAAIFTRTVQDVLMPANKKIKQQNLTKSKDLRI